MGAIQITSSPINVVTPILIILVVAAIIAGVVVAYRRRHRRHGALETKAQAGAQTARGLH